MYYVIIMHIIVISNVRICIYVHTGTAETQHSSGGDLMVIFWAVGVSVGVVAVLISLSAVIICVLWTRRRRRRAKDATSGDDSTTISRFSHIRRSLTLNRSNRSIKIIDPYWVTTEPTDRLPTMAETLYMKWNHKHANERAPKGKVPAPATSKDTNSQSDLLTALSPPLSDTTASHTEMSSSSSISDSNNILVSPFSDQAEMNQENESSVSRAPPEGREEFKAKVLFKPMRTDSAPQLEYKSGTELKCQNDLEDEVGGYSIIEPRKLTQDNRSGSTSTSSLLLEIDAALENKAFNTLPSNYERETQNNYAKSMKSKTLTRNKEINKTGFTQQLEHIYTKPIKTPKSKDC